MPIFQYKAYNADGKEISGELEALGLKDASRILKKDGLYPKELSLFEKRENILSRRYSRISLNELAAVTRQISVLIKSGSSLYDSLSILINETENKGLKAGLINIKERISEGSSFARALESHRNIFSEMYQRMVEAGEASGALDKVLIKLADYLEARAKIQEKVRTALIYPALMTAVGICVLSFLFIFVIPKITRIFEDTKQALPLITVILLNAVNLFRNYWHIILITIGSAGWGIKEFIKRPKGKALKDKLLFKIPWIGRVFANFYMANFAYTLGSLLNSGVPMLKAIDMTKRVLNNAVFEKILDKAVKDITEGASLSASLRNSDIITGILIHMIATGERSGNLDSLLLNSADTYEKDFETSVGRALSLLEPVLILAMGFIVGFIVLAILLPIFELNQIAR